MDAVAIMADEVRELIRRRGLDPARDVSGLRRLVEDVVADYDTRTLSGMLPPLADGGRAVKQVLDEVAGLGPLQQYLDDPSVEEIWINEPGKVFVARHGRGHRFAPHRVNYRATPWALRAVGVRQVLSPCAVGSLRPEHGPGVGEP